MKKITSLAVLLTLSSSFAKDVTHTLDKYGDTISKKMIEFNYIETKNDLKEIKRVLKLNNLSLSKAKRLPVGYLFYIFKGAENNDKALAGASNVSTRLGGGSHSFSFELGSFYYAQALGQSSLYSDLSQYVGIGYKLNDSWFADLGIKRFVYSKDAEQNLTEDESRSMHSVSLGKIIKLNRWESKLGIYNKNVLNYETSSLNQVSIDSANTTGLSLGASTRFWQGRGVSINSGATVQKNLSSSSLNEYLSVSPYLSSGFKYNKTKLAVVLRYAYSQVETKTSDYTDQLASLGLKAFF